MKKQFLQKRVVETKAPITKRPEKQLQDLLFTTTANTPLNAQIVCDAIKRIVKEMNTTRDILDEMQTFSCHCFRRTFATRCFEAGIKPKTVQSYLGHSSLQMTMDLYTAVMPEHLSSEMDKLDIALAEMVSEEFENELVQQKYTYNMCDKSSKSL